MQTHFSCTSLPFLALYVSIRSFHLQIPLIRRLSMNLYLIILSSFVYHLLKCIALLQLYEILYSHMKFGFNLFSRNLNIVLWNCYMLMDKYLQIIQLLFYAKLYECSSPCIYKIVHLYHWFNFYKKIQLMFCKYAYLFCLQIWNFILPILQKNQNHQWIFFSCLQDIQYDYCYD